MRLGRWLRQLLLPPWWARLAASRRTLAAIEEAIARAEPSHDGRIRFAIETASPSACLLRRVCARTRALEVFSTLRVWDTERNNGVLIYLSWAERAIEIVADRGLADRVRQSEWQAVCRLLEGYYREGRFREGSVAGIEAVGRLLARHFPRGAVAGPSPSPSPAQGALL